MTIHRLSLLVFYYYLSLLLSSAKAFRLAFKPPFVRSPIQLECCPLIGGPKFAPLHVQVVVFDNNDDNKHKFDFVPQEATKPETLARLLTLKSVPGDLRYLAPSTTTTEAFSSPLVQRAQEFTASYEDSNLHVITNNCWTFAWKLVRHLEREEE